MAGKLVDVGGGRIANIPAKVALFSAAVPTNILWVLAGFCWINTAWTLLWVEVMRTGTPAVVIVILPSGNHAILPPPNASSTKATASATTKAADKQLVVRESLDAILCRLLPYLNAWLLRPY